MTVSMFQGAKPRVTTRHHTPILIGLYSPAAQSGKSTASAVMTGLHGFTNVKFAGPLKDMTRAFLRAAGIPEADIERMVEGDLKEKPIAVLGGVTPRRIMETIGTDWGRKTITEGLWVDVTEARIRALMDAGRSVVVDDMRFPNELHLIQRLGGRAVRIDRPGAVPTEFEGRLNDYFFDFYFENRGDINAFRGDIDRFVTRQAHTG